MPVMPMGSNLASPRGSIVSIDLALLQTLQTHPLALLVYMQVKLSRPDYVYKTIGPLILYLRSLAITKDGLFYCSRFKVMTSKNSCSKQPGEQIFMDLYG